MWADGETADDLLGFDVLVDELVVALTDPKLLPLTVGVLGDWGSGKSSLLRLVQAELEGIDDAPYLCVQFSPWQYEDYEDVKIALLQAILQACRERNALPAVQEQISRLSRFASRLRRRARAAGRAAIASTPAIVPLAVGAFDPGMASATQETMQQIVDVAAPIVAAAVPAAPDAAAEDEPPTAPEITDLAEFRRAFEDLLDGLAGIDSVVVFVDDLDRCLPDTIVDTFEAIRLFLDSPRTAYVIGTSRSIVESAIDSRYPDLRRPDGRGIGHDYLEKMLQLQVSLPVLSAAETETYVNALIAQLHLPAAQWQQVRVWLRDARLADPFGAVLDGPALADVLGPDLPADLAAELAWTGPISAILAGSLRGNPRQTKRFLNDLTWRRRAAARRRIELRHDVLAKLMVLEETSLDDLQLLFDWQLRSTGPAPELDRAEQAARHVDGPPDAAVEHTLGGSGHGAPARSTDVAADQARPTPAESTSSSEPEPEQPPRPRVGGTSRTRRSRATEAAAAAPDPKEQDPAELWASRPSVRRWLKLEPDLSGLDLRAYFSYFRSRLLVRPADAALPPELQSLLIRLLGTKPQYQAAATEWAQLAEPEQDRVVEALLDAVRSQPDSEALAVVAGLAERAPRIAPEVCTVLGRLPHARLPVSRLPGVLRHLRGLDGYDALHAGWLASSSPPLAKLAQATRTRTLAEQATGSR